MPRILNILSGDSKIQCIEYDLGTRYQSVGRYVRFGFDKIPYGQACIRGHHITKPDAATLAERVSLFSSSLENMGLWDAIDAVQVVSKKSFYCEAVRICDAIQSRTGIATTLLGIRDIEFLPDLQDEDMVTITGLAMQGIEGAETVIAFLNEQGYLSELDKTALTPLLKEMADQINAQSALTAELLPEQSVELRTLFEPLLDQIIDCCTSLTTSEAIVGNPESWGHYLEEPIIPRDIAFASLVHASYDAHSLIDQEFVGLQAISAAADLLNKIYSGSTQREFLLLEKGIPIPSLSLQRKFLFEMIEQKLNEKFGPEDLSRIPPHLNPIDVLEARKQTFIDGFYLEMISKPRVYTIPSIAIRVDPLAHSINLFR